MKLRYRSTEILAVSTLFLSRTVAKGAENSVKVASLLVSVPGQSLVLTSADNGTHLTAQ